MKAVTNTYFNFFVFLYGLYAYFNKGVAYTYLVEALLVIGMLLILNNLRNYIIQWSLPVKLIILFIVITSISLVLSIGKYPFFEIVQDSFMFYYAFFVFIIFLFADKLELLKQKIFIIYKWYPLVVFVGFLLVSYIPFFQDFVLFGEIPLLLYKYGDMGVHLLIATLLLIGGWIQLPRKWYYLNLVLIVLLFLIVASYNRAGMLAYLVGLVTFLFIHRKKFSKEAIGSYIKLSPFFIVLALGLYMNANVEENFQGRKLGLEQLQQNITSIISQPDEGSLADNKVWRLAWWYKLGTDALQPKNAIVGQGLGVNLASISDVKVDNDNLRSPHNFHLNILARFGFIILGIWLYFIWLHLKRIRASEKNEFNVTVLIFILAFLINSTFDVYLEGPMGAFPFWTWLGILYLNDAKAVKI